MSDTISTPVYIYILLLVVLLQYYNIQYKCCIYHREMNWSNLHAGMAYIRKEQTDYCSNKRTFPHNFSAALSTGSWWGKLNMLTVHAFLYFLEQRWRHTVVPENWPMTWSSGTLLAKTDWDSVSMQTWNFWATLTVRVLLSTRRKPCRVKQQRRQWTEPMTSLTHHAYLGLRP